MLSDLCDTSRGITYGIVKVGEFVPNGVPVIRGGDIRNNRIEFDDAKRVTPEVSQQFSRTVLQGGEVIINLIAEPGHCAVVSREFSGFNVSRDVAVIPLGREVNHGFVNWFLKSPQAIDWLTSRMSGSVTQKINLRDLKDLPIPTPPPLIQDAVASILGALDDKIAVNERIAATVDELAGLLFRGCVGLAPRVITDVASITMGQSPPGETYNETGDGLPFYQGTKDFGMRYPRRRVWCSAVTRFAYENDVLVSVRAPVGKINVAVEGCGIGRGVAAVRSPRYPHVMLHALSSDKSVWRPYEAEGTVFGAINKKQFSQLEVSWPSELYIDGLESQLRALDDRLRQTAEESCTLAALRDTLLPQLMSGRLRVKDAEKIVEDHT
ncbi:restriction endonuclease subunit S [Streptomyces sp. NPDC059740]|uniref:restriction endonuclease subunit S n=1 Tax=Streptomyces sp. NPDC059740 TaxID=3346926 RepID=UPI00364F188B